MPAFLHPGVYVLEVPSGARSIEAASTSTCIIVGQTERGPLTPTKVTSRSDFSRLFGDYLRQNTGGSNAVAPTLAYAADAFFGNGGSTAYILRIMSAPPGGTATRQDGGAANPNPKWRLQSTSPGMWAVGTATAGLFAIFMPSSDADSSKVRLVVVYTPLATGLPTIVEDWDHLSTNPNDENYVVDTLNRSLYVRWDTTVNGGNWSFPTLANLDFTPTVATPATAANIIAKAVPGITNFSGSALGGNTDPTITNFSDALALLDDIVDASVIIAPWVAQGSNNGSFAVQLNKAVCEYAENRPRHDLFAIGDLGRKNSETLATNATQKVVSEDYSQTTKTTFGATYWPWVQVNDPAGSGKDPTVWISPSAAVAGIFARTDSARGVWKAPAGLDATILGIRKIEFTIQDIQQDILNPLGINALRNQPAGGPVVWGARTMRPDTEWRYVPVRRMAIFLRVSIYNGIQFAVFEPNDEPLWSALRLAIGGFMDRLFRQGAFAGATPKDAYFVKADSETTTPSDQLAGFVNVLVGFAPLRPAEFVVVKLSQIVSQKA